MAADFRSVRVYGRQLTADEIAHNALIDRIRFEGETPPTAIAPSISLSQVANAAVAGEALLALEVDDFGWLASSLTSCAVEYASTSDFSSSSSVAAILYDGVTGAARISSLTPGATYYARAVATNDLGTDFVGEAIAFVAQETATAALKYKVPYITTRAAAHAAVLGIAASRRNCGGVTSLQDYHASIVR